MKERISEIPNTDAQDKPVTAPVEMDDAAIRKMCRDELVIALKANSGKPVIANLVNALLDRIDGKPMQAVQLDATVKQVTFNANIRFIDAIDDSKTIEHQS